MRGSRIYLTMTTVLGLVIGCSSEKASTPTASQAAPKSPMHRHGVGPHGGVVFDLGKYHAEFTVNRSTHEGIIYMLDDDEESPLDVQANELFLTIQSAKDDQDKTIPQTTISLTPAEVIDGKTRRLQGRADVLGKIASFRGTVAGEIDGKPVLGSFQWQTGSKDMPKK